jgi:phosphoadenosine phosphosulfate reductase
MDIAQRLAGHKVALQLSGGKDSLACLQLLVDHLDDLTVYWTNPGDAYPETLRVIEYAKAKCPHFVEIRTDIQAWRAVHGVASDLIPTSCTHMGMMAGESTMKVTDRMHCCYSNIMLPMHQRMLADGITMIIRGVRADDPCVSPTKDGDVIDGIEFFYPVYGWSADDVLEYLMECGAPISPVYDYLEGCPDCLHCTAWLNEGRGEYLKTFHPDAHRQYVITLKEIGGYVNRHLEQLLKEID